ncbi:MAG: histidinol dehydrogenase [Chitinophagaceae bacterium]|nr:histidinol dehydrogenase [Chitinophagaceae bacterium]
MQIIKHPLRSEWKKILQRPAMDTPSLESRVSHILKEIKENGDEAVRRFSLMFDKVSINDMEVSDAEVQQAGESLPENLKAAIRAAKENIERFHKAQLTTVEVIETMPGVKCWRKSLPIERVGLYIPGGTAPLFSTMLMLGIPAKIAGCKEIILCSPPDKEGKLHPAILYAAGLVGITKIFKAGGVQAIGAMAYGTDTIPQAFKIFGPGNQYVTAAKLLVQKDGTAIDMPAGPSEVAVYADGTANPVFVAADLLSQAEHGEDSQVLLVVIDEALVQEVRVQIEKQLEILPRKDMAAQALKHSKIIIAEDEQVAIDLLNEYAAEHLILSCSNPEQVAEKVISAGSVFLGHYSPESVGDYASGTNHTLPTNGYARSYSGVSVDSFVKKVTFQQLTKEGLDNIGGIVELMARAEGLDAHANAVSVRL